MDSHENINKPPENWKRGSVIQFKSESGTFSDRFHIIRKVEADHIIVHTGVVIKNFEDFELLDQPETRHLSRLLDNVEAKAQQAQELETKLINEKQRNKELEQTIAAQTLTIEKHDRVVAEKDWHIVNLRKKNIQLQEGTIKQSNAELTTAQAQIETLKQERNELKAELGKLKNPEMIIRLQNNNPIQFATITGIDLSVLDMQIAQYRSNGWRIVDFADIPLYTVEGAEEKDIQRVYTFRHIVRFERTNPDHQPEQRVATAQKMDDAIAAALGDKPKGSHISILTMGEVADIGYATGEEVPEAAPLL